MRKKNNSKEWFDPVVEETRERGRTFTARFDNDPKKILNELRRIEKKDPRKSKYVSEVKVIKKLS